jgi:uncharacterized protein (TIGR02117 family)
VSHGWHSGLVFTAADLPAGSLLRRAFPHAVAIEVGWGDRAFYMAREPGVWLGLRALAWPTPGVLHVVGLAGPPRTMFPDSEVVDVHVSQPRLDRMHEAVEASFERDVAGDPIALGEGLYGNGRFYASRERFHGLRTCNVWAAQVLQHGGLPLQPLLAITTTGLLRQAARLKPAT